MYEYVCEFVCERMHVFRVQERCMFCAASQRTLHMHATGKPSHEVVEISERTLESTPYM
jgi:hypothetical protein